MEKRKFYTLVKANKLKENLYILGRISGIMHCMCVKDENDHWGNAGIDDGIVMTVRCTPDEYFEFAKVIRDQYPDYCAFDLKVRARA